MEIFLALSIVILATNLLLGFFIYFGNRKNRIHQAYLLLTLSVAIWIFGLILLSPPFGKKLSHLFFLIEKIPFVGSSFVAIFFFWFSYLFPKRLFVFSIPIRIIVFALMMGLVGISLVFRLAPLKILDSHQYQMDFHPFFRLWSLLFLLFLGGGLGILFRKYLKSTGIEKVQIKYFFIGALLSLGLAITTNLLFPLFGIPISLWQYGPLALIFSMVFTTYGITKHHLMNLKIVTTELLVGLVMVVLLVDLLLSKTILTFFIKLVILIAFCYLGVSLIQSVLQEIKRREEIEKMSFRLKKAYKELKRVDKAKSHFIAMASHQLRTPLTIIKGFVSMLREGSYGEPPERFKGPLKNIFDSNERLIKIVNDLLSISKIELGKMELEKERVQIEKIIEDVFEELKSEAKKKNLDFKYEKPERPLEKIEIDPLKIRQVIFCLVDNAIRYTKKGRVEIKYQKKDNKYQIVVSDTGEGLTKKEKKKIFEAFIRGEAGISYWIQGTGLGLYLAKKYIELHKGKIWAESPGKGKGSTFYIELPIL